MRRSGLLLWFMLIGWLATAVAVQAQTVRALDVTDLSAGTYLLTIRAEGTVGLVPLVLIRPGVPTPPPPPVGSLTDKVKAWTLAVGDPATAAKVAVGYKTVANRIRAGTFRTKQQVVDVQKQVNAVMFSDAGGKKAAWLEWEKTLAAELEALEKAGQLNDLPSMAVAWDQVASGVEAAGTAAIDWEKLIQLILTILELILKLIGGGAA